MTTQPHPADVDDLDTTHADTLARLLEVQAKIADLTDEAEALKATLRELAPGDYAIGGRPVLRIIPTRRFDPKKALTLVPAERRQDCLKVEPDAAKIKQLLTPEQADECMVVSGKPKVVAL